VVDRNNASIHLVYLCHCRATHYNFMRVVGLGQRSVDNPAIAFETRREWPFAFDVALPVNRYQHGLGNTYSGFLVWHKTMFRAN
jgi:hypothetical protein